MLRTGKNDGLVVAGLLFLVAFLLWNYGDGLPFFNLGEPQLCSVDPFDSECYCAAGERKISNQWASFQLYACENIEDILLDPESPTFQNDAISYVINTLETQCGDFCDLNCGENKKCEEYGGYANMKAAGVDSCINAAWGTAGTGERIVIVECTKTTQWNGNYPMSGYTPWQMNFFVESDTGIPKVWDVFADSNYCVDAALTDRCVPDIEIVPHP